MSGRDNPVVVLSITEAHFGMNSVEQAVEIVAPGIGITACWECGGDGDWGKFCPWDPEPGTVECVPCKGTGKRYVDAWASPT